MPNTHSLTGQTALVTGGTRGIGRAVAASLLGAGAEVVLTGTRREAAEQVAAELSREFAGAGLAHGAACDVTSDESVNALVSLVRERCGGLHILINNAGVGIYRPTPDLSLDDFRQVVETNLTGVFRMTKAFLPFLLESGQRARNDAPSGATVVNIGSLAGAPPFQGRRRLQRVQVRARRAKRGDDARPPGRGHPGGHGHAGQRLRPGSPEGRRTTAKSGSSPRKM